MRSLTQAQKALLALFLILGGAWLALRIGTTISFYRGGDLRQTAMLARIAPDIGIAALGVGFVIIMISRIEDFWSGLKNRNNAGNAQDGQGQPVSGTPPYFRSPGHAANLVLWIGIAVLLVFFFNWYQDHPGGTKASVDWNSLIINVVPILLMVGFWIFIFIWINRKKKDGDGGN